MVEKTPGGRSLAEHLERARAIQDKPQIPVRETGQPARREKDPFKWGFYSGVARYILNHPQG